MAHGASLRQKSDDPELANHLMHDYTKADLDPQTRGMLDFAVKLTLTPGAMRESDVLHLRGLGLTDEEILSTTLVSCFYNFMTRLADGLGVEIRPGFEQQARKWMSAEVMAQDWLTTPVIDRK